MVTYYSQHGEDYLAHQLFGDTGSGFYVEVGALDGKRFSNTYLFEQLGWDGVCVEAHPRYLELCRRNRPAAICVHAAVCDHDRPTTFYANDRGTLSAIEPMPAKELDRYGPYFSGYDKIQVPGRTLTGILAEAEAPRSPAMIHLLSVDVEGHEEAVFAGTDFDQYRFGLIFTERSQSRWSQRRITKSLERQGYTMARELGANVVYCHKSVDPSPIINMPVDVPLKHLPHPMDVD